MAEEFAVNGAFGDGSAVYGDVAGMFAGAESVDYLREKFLARAAFACHEHRQVNRRHLDGAGDGSDELRGVAHNAKAHLGLLYFWGYVVEIQLHG